MSIDVAAAPVLPAMLLSAPRAPVGRRTVHVIREQDRHIGELQAELLEARQASA